MAAQGRPPSWTALYILFDFLVCSPSLVFATDTRKNRGECAVCFRSTFPGPVRKTFTTAEPVVTHQHCIKLFA
ncbi:hypothetical protein F4777DRAFT_516817 [Nemania sp. FL0916]|nr:hypothetical protein F4777DRAFT_516817 [Nemania sp. FL0916]